MVRSTDLFPNSSPTHDVVVQTFVYQEVYRTRKSWSTDSTKGRSRMRVGARPGTGKNRIAEEMRQCA
jgi:hypothetical protein